ncbi:MAG: VWA domain-containing protein [Anaerolineae bacterium]
MMKAITRPLLAMLALLLALWPQAVLADGMMLPLDAEIGYLIVPYHHVRVKIEDTHATTHVSQAFENPHDHDVTARYLFPVPPDAMLTTFEATVDGRAQAAQRQDVDATNALLWDLVAERHDPSLLQYADWETLVFEVTVPAGGTREITLAYEEVLTPEGGMLHYHYVLGTERYVSDLLEEVSVTIDVASSKGLGTLYSPSHDVATTRTTNGQARVSWEASYVRPTEDFHLFYAPTEGGFGSGLLTGRQPDLESDHRDHFLFLFAPEAGRAERAPLPKDIVFVVDRSGSMAGEKLVQAQNALQFILGQLNERDRFSVVGFDDRIDLLSPELLSVNGETVRTARRFVDGLYAREATDLDAALAQGLAVLRSSQARADATRLLVFLTDGLPTAGITDPALIARRAGRANDTVEARLHVFGVGYDVNTHLLDRLAAENGGSVTYVQPGEDLEAVLTGFYRRIASPVLTDLEIDFEGFDVQDLHPATLPDLFDGSSLLLTGRYVLEAGADEVTVRVRGRAGGEARSYTYTYDLKEAGDHAFVPRLWATRQIGRLLDAVRVEGETDRLVEEIRRLGLSYGLVTPYTTFAIAAQTSGAASMENMALYSDQGALNQAHGKTTIQARVQNQSYQQAAQANLAGGANVTQSGYQNLAQVSTQHVDLRLLRNARPSDTAIDEAWITENLKADRTVEFGSDAYFELAGDPTARGFLQAGNNVLFQHRGEIIQVVDPEGPASVFELAMPAGSDRPSQLLDNRSAPLGTPQAPRAAWLSQVRLVIRRAADVLAGALEALGGKENVQNVPR